MRRFILLFASLCIIGYALFEARRLIEGPTLSITYPSHQSATSSVVLEIRGEAHNIAFLTINDTPFYTDEHGVFVYRFSPPSGYTVVTVSATDRFGRHSTKSISVHMLNYCPLVQ